MIGNTSVFCIPSWRLVFWYPIPATSQQEWEKNKIQSVIYKLLKTCAYKNTHQKAYKAKEPYKRP